MFTICPSAKLHRLAHGACWCQRTRTDRRGVRRKAPRAHAAVPSRSGTDRAAARSKSGRSRRTRRRALRHDGGGWVPRPSRPGGHDECRTPSSSLASCLAWRMELARNESRQPARATHVGLPLGLFDDITYDRLVLKPRAGDFLLLFSDGVCESKSPAGIELARDGLIDMVRTLDSSALSHSARNSHPRFVPFAETLSLWMTST